MTNLSPAAQEVDNAIADIEAQIEFADLASGFNAYRKAVAAAALRAAAQLKFIPNMLDKWDVIYAEGWDGHCNELLAIAAELEGKA